MKRFIIGIRHICQGIAIMGMLVTGTQRGLADDQNPGHLRTQEIALHAGWNAVYLEVAPVAAAPAEVFAGLPVDRVATLIPFGFLRRVCGHTNIFNAETI